MKTTRSDLVCALTIFFLLLCPVVAAGACDYRPGGDPAGSLMELYDTGCLGGSSDAAPLSRNVFDLLSAEVPADSPRRARLGLRAIDRVQESFRGLPLQGGKNELERKLAQAMDLAEAELDGEIPPSRIATPGVWALDLDDLSVQLSDTLTLDFEATYLQPDCARPDSEECARAFDRAVMAMRHLDLVRRSLDYVVRDRELGAVIMQAKLRRQQWDVYFEQGYPQWPWELYVNGLFYRDRVEEEPGLAEPPSWQLVLLHPDVALEYVDAADDGDRFKPAVLVEFIGGDWWSWNDEGRQEGPWGLPVALGAGLIGTYTDRAGTEDWGLGAMLRISHSYNLGVTTRSGDDVGIFVSANLSKLITGFMAPREAWFGVP